MPRYNLIDDQESDNFDSYFKEPDLKKEKESEIKPNTDFDIPAPVDTPKEENPFELESESDFGTHNESFDVPAAQDTLPVEEDFAPTEQPADTNPSYNEDYEDSKQDKINYKPILIIAVIIAVIIIGYFITTKFIFKSTEIEAVAETAAPVKTEREIQRENFLKNIIAINTSKINFLSKVHNSLSGDVNFSSVLLYDKDLSIEVFSKNRDALAPFNLEIKNNPALLNLVLSTTATRPRPGSTGGIFALYTTDNIPEDARSSASLTDSIGYKTPSDFTTVASNQYGLTLKEQREISTNTQALFSVKRMEYQFSGALKDCWQFITYMGADNANYRIYKLNFLPIDQKSIAKSSYQLNVLIDFYL
jgi:hypothetical protein